MTKKSDAEAKAAYEKITAAEPFAEIRLRACARDYAAAVDTRGEAKAYRELKAAALNMGRVINKRTRAR